MYTGIGIYIHMQSFLILPRLNCNKRKFHIKLPSAIISDATSG